MDTKTCTQRASDSLVTLSQRLRLYEPPALSLRSTNQQQHHATQDLTSACIDRKPELVSELLHRRPNRARAAVLICLFEGDDGDLRVILTKRASTLSSHPGEVCLPGGKRDEADSDDVETALREAKEEIGLEPSLVDVVTVLEQFVTKRGVAVVPVVAILFDKKAYHPTLNPTEVEEIFDVPLQMFLKDENRRAEEREWMGDKYQLQYFDHATGEKKYVIFALTAGILIRAASIVYQRPPAFTELCPKFWH